jgi:hypothetical protein
VEGNELGAVVDDIWVRAEMDDVGSDGIKR